ncbi:MAG: hypothetical protein Pg6C_21010 [Treponemataceae bacterium]|nr:MAG: hypothetical protein Pg6C_21010 [Treponemataceae bacterium]
MFFSRERRIFIPLRLRVFVRGYLWISFKAYIKEEKKEAIVDTITVCMGSSCFGKGNSSNAEYRTLAGNAVKEPGARL